MSVVRDFATYLRTLDPTTEVPDSMAATCSDSNARTSAARRLATLGTVWASGPAIRPSTCQNRNNDRSAVANRCVVFGARRRRLRHCGVAATSIEELVERYRGYLLVERGLQVKAARGYVDLIRPFIAGRVSADGVELEALTAGEVTAFLVAQSRRHVPHLRPAHPRIRGISKIPATPTTVTRRRQCLGPIRRHRRRQPRALVARLPTRLALFGPLPR